MNNKDNKVLDMILEKKIITIVRGIYGDDLRKLANALYEGGIRFMEVTFDQNDLDCIAKTTDAISMLNTNFSDCDFYTGAGTVLTKAQVKAAFNAGAKYIISPNTNPEVIRYTKELGLVSIPGAMTPTEILLAHDCGADIVKLFPATSLGLKFVKDILTPISHVAIIATAGITEENFAEFLKLGLKGAGISGRLTDKKLIAEGNWAEFTRRAKAFVKIANENRKTGW